jgi:hypothetical protein
MSSSPEWPERQPVGTFVISKDDLADLTLSELRRAMPSIVRWTTGFDLQISNVPQEDFGEDYSAPGPVSFRLKGDRVLLMVEFLSDTDEWGEPAPLPDVASLAGVLLKRSALSVASVHIRDEQHVLESPWTWELELSPTRRSNRLSELWAIGARILALLGAAR